jgi:hypothetical protein
MSERHDCRGVAPVLLGAAKAASADNHRTDDVPPPKKERPDGRLA